MNAPLLLPHPNLSFLFGLLHFTLIYQTDPASKAYKTCFPSIGGPWKSHIFLACHPSFCVSKVSIFLSSLSFSSPFTTPLTPYSGTRIPLCFNVFQEFPNTATRGSHASDWSFQKGQTFEAVWTFSWRCWILSSNCPCPMQLLLLGLQRICWNVWSLRSIPEVYFASENRFSRGTQSWISWRKGWWVRCVWG